jgi:FxLD family lantipeptide
MDGCPSGGATALLERPVDVFDEDEFTLDVRVIVEPHLACNQCPTNDGCGESCKNGASACSSYVNNQF